ncbi:MAG: hypothetical protein KAS72_02785 [Phycisphaerales bacterium]|nr:hypothetical protein [Phycisphaerales bacterium]
MKQYDGKRFLLFKDGMPFSELADLLVGEPVEDGGLIYREVVSTLPGIPLVHPGHQFVVRDRSTGNELISFLCERSYVVFDPEQFTKMVGKQYIRSPMKTTGERGLAVLEPYPELRAIGRGALQVLCQAWLKTPVAKECGVAAVEIREEGDTLTISVGFRLTHAVSDEEDCFFPMDRLLQYLAEEGLGGEGEGADVLDRITRLRRKVGPDVFQRFTARTGPSVPLLLRCKNTACGHLMMSQFRKRHSESIQWGPHPVCCPRCKISFPYDQDDLFVMPDSEECN